MPVMSDIKPFSVVHGKYLYIFTPSEEGGFAVTCQNVDGVNAQGDTFEEALECAVSMTAFVQEVQTDLAKSVPVKHTPRSKPGAAFSRSSKTPKTTQKVKLAARNPNKR